MKRQQQLFPAASSDDAAGGLIVDLFAGGGGASAGIERAAGRSVDIAINHDPIAIKVHAGNHPKAEHLQASVWEVRPIEATRGRPVELLWASPDCTHFSVAKGGAPVSKNIRSLAWVVVRWAAETRPRIILLENVREFLSWGPLNSAGRPSRPLEGEEFRRWVEALRQLGYAVEWRVLDASQFGAPTRRRRLFVVARCDGEAATWPAPTHGEPPLLPLRTAAECIDWSLPCPSIFTRKRALAEKTMKRIAEGLRRFVLESPRPFIVKVNHGGAGFRGQSADEPLSTVTAARRGHALVTAWLAKHYGGVYGQKLSAPVGTITTRDHHALVASSLVKLRGQCNGASVEEPVPTITAQGCHIGEVRAFLTTYYGSGGGQLPSDPLRTITSKARLGLVTVEGIDYQIADIGMRMLEPAELLRAQFGEFANAYDLSAATSKAAKIRLIGNSVAPAAAEALVRANLRATKMDEVAA